MLYIIVPFKIGTPADFRNLFKTLDSVNSKIEFIDQVIIRTDLPSERISNVIMERYNQKVTLETADDGGLYAAMNNVVSRLDDNINVLFMGAGDELLSLPLGINLSMDEILVGNVKMGIDSTFVSKTCFWSQAAGNQLHHQGVIVPVKIYSDYHFFDENYPIYADFDFFTRVLKSKKIKFSRDPHFVTRFDTSGISSSPNIREQCSIISRHFGIFSSIKFAVRRLIALSMKKFQRKFIENE